MKPIVITAFALAAVLPAAAHAERYDVLVPEHSEIRFTYSQMGVTMRGDFRTFSGELDFDPSDPTAARARIDVELASIGTGFAEADDEVAGREWFDTARFPTARFESSTIHPIGEDRFEVSGTLSIKGTALPVVVPATVRTEGDRAVFDGSLAIRRGDFSVGEGAWSRFDLVANEVTIEFRITAASGD